MYVRNYNTFLFCNILFGTFFSYSLFSFGKKLNDLLRCMLIRFFFQQKLNTKIPLLFEIAPDRV